MSLAHVDRQHATEKGFLADMRYMYIPCTDLAPSERQPGQAPVVQRLVAHQPVLLQHPACLFQFLVFALVHALQIVHVTHHHFNGVTDARLLRKQTANKQIMRV